MRWTRHKPTTARRRWPLFWPSVMPNHDINVAAEAPRPLPREMHCGVSSEPFCRTVGALKTHSVWLWRSHALNPRAWGGVELQSHALPWHQSYCNSITQPGKGEQSPPVSLGRCLCTTVKSCAPWAAACKPPWRAHLYGEGCKCCWAEGFLNTAD